MVRVTFLNTVAKGTGQPTTLKTSKIEGCFVSRDYSSSSRSWSCSASWIGGRNEAQLLQRSQSTFLASLLNNLSIPQCKNRSPRKVNFTARVGTLQLAHREICKCHPSVLPTSNPSRNDVICFSDHGDRSVWMERDVRECLAGLAPD
jgi:hypothetical protein